MVTSPVIVKIRIFMENWPILTPKRPLISTKIHSHVSLVPVVLWPEFGHNRSWTRQTFSPKCWRLIKWPILTPRRPPTSTKMHLHMSLGPAVLWSEFHRNRTKRWCNFGQMLTIKWPVLTSRWPPTPTKMHSHVSLGPVVLWPKFRRNRPLHSEEIEKVCTNFWHLHRHTDTHTKHDANRSFSASRATRATRTT